MTQLLFRNRWFALIWALAICFSISRFFEAGGGQEQLAKTAQDIRAKRAEEARQQAIRQTEYGSSQTMPEGGEAELNTDGTYEVGSEAASEAY